ncbi:MAG: NAD(P)/FAD-dependent oxidoreductase [Bacteroidia bacterium]|nr:NAD(P)/FAD-dependent oxidoreductase [Bacteroidia bacterium]
MQETNTLIIGAGPSGLATAARLGRAGIPYLILEKADRPGPAWHNHYDRLHLHTSKHRSWLPFVKFPKDYPKYPSRQQVADYLGQYAAKLNIRPLYGQKVVSAVRKDGFWDIQSETDAFRAKNLVVASGLTAIPRKPDFPGLESFKGEVLHTKFYKNAHPFKGKKVLVVGFGNSAGEIAMDLHEGGASASLAVRSPVNIIPRDVGPFSSVSLGIAIGFLPDKWLDANSRMVTRNKFGDLAKLGLKQADMGPKEILLKKGRVTLIDFGVMKYIQSGEIRIFPGLKSVEGNLVHFTDGRSEEFEVILLGTGYYPDLSFLPEMHKGERYDQGNPPRVVGEGEGLYFAGFQNRPGGAFRGFGFDARDIVQDVLRRG